MREAAQLESADRSLLQFSVAFDEPNWALRVDSAVKYLEAHAALPREPLDRALVDKKLVRIDDRIRYLQRAARSKYREFLLTNGRSATYTPTGVPIERGHVAVRGTLSTGSPPLWELEAQFAGLLWERRQEVFADLGDLLAAHTGHTTPAAAASMLVAYSMASSPENAHNQAGWHDQAAPLLALLEQQRIELPTLCMWYCGGVRVSPWQPDMLGWINYWSAQTCEYLGFPQAGRDDDLLQRSARTPAGAWVVKITPEPLDLSIVDHVRMVADVYARYPRLGIRMAV